MARTIDKSKKSNVKCEHCGHWACGKTSKCLLSGEEKLYYNRCKNFSWREDKQYVGEGGAKNG